MMPTNRINQKRVRQSQQFQLRQQPACLLRVFCLSGRLVETSICSRPSVYYNKDTDIRTRGVYPRPDPAFMRSSVEQHVLVRLIKSLPGCWYLVESEYSRAYFSGHAKLHGRVIRVRRVLRRTPGYSNSN